ncbi:potassium-transporting ATPase subunit KdpC [Salipaludibacillus agaradhaerens]|jgi:K+-transporting ATPase ATPase C chain|uniref:Potassium-transporting ATPase KdpC subunit n=1 Tax=Salipaludibacillus agaradhaerens TaxID=76935 RepID=A0A9Q4FY96_SALAG|nr:potassium-transporting ATPase subunit KdpC [Salipaludibacillus agaradhaerens]MCR6096136.1 potassium-transporting ATPase subunit KdpC [Salipaludibacillus agaradhaerens]MCR6114305.1 potassium-transporting ATPase subunit KdpC [Salipaludibacillus agaradhaerens]
MFKLDVPFLSLIRLSFIIMLLCGVIYPVAMTGVAQVTMNDKANGSILYNEEGDPIGSQLIGQSFHEPYFFHGRISSIEYDGRNSGSENYAPVNTEMLERVYFTINEWTEKNQHVSVHSVPVDLLTNSGSGLDPHITPEAAMVQIPRISDVLGIEETRLVELVREHIEGKDWGIFGAERVNVLQLNLSLLELID